MGYLLSFFLLYCSPRKGRQEKRYKSCADASIELLNEMNIHQFNLLYLLYFSTKVFTTTSAIYCLLLLYILGYWEATLLICVAPPIVTIPPPPQYTHQLRVTV